MSIETVEFGTGVRKAMAQFISVEAIRSIIGRAA
ncbi:hypothetical protein GGR38_004654 [Novosphingobium sediminicola]|uniref:Uncharacterized protein n=1 Tax=Novosphingobium sediminicola TaxID=563162 RepID=A0A7W6CN47_9SPHN|nr:hypothetical protein [Novosphingobium sediminicola]